MSEEGDRMKITRLILSIILAAVSLCGCDAMYYLPEDFLDTAAGVDPAEVSITADDMSDKMEVNFIDVGQGDCALVRLPDGRNMLIDAGNNGDIDKIGAYLAQKGADRIDFLIGTHPHADHIGALDDIVKNYDIGEIYMPKASANTKTYRSVLEAISEKGMKIKTAKSGMVIFDENGVKAEILSPSRENYEDLNDYSVVIRLSYGETAFLFQGDAEETVERDILESGADIKADVIKAGHHGSSTSSSKEYIKKVGPEYAVISCGRDNDYGHPHRETVQLFNELGIEMLRTDISGSIVFVSDGKNVKYIKATPHN